MKFEHPNDQLPHPDSNPDWLEEVWMETAAEIEYEEKHPQGVHGGLNCPGCNDCDAADYYGGWLGTSMYPLD